MRKTLSVTPVIDTNAYTAEDQVGASQTLLTGADAFQAAELEEIIILDKAKQSAEITIFFFDRSPTIASANNEAISITDAEMEKCIGHVTIVAGDYKAVAASSVARKAVDPKLVLKPSASGTAGTIYAVAKTAGTPTYGSASDLIVQYKFKS